MCAYIQSNMQKTYKGGIKNIFHGSAGKTREDFCEELTTVCRTAHVECHIILTLAQRLDKAIAPGKQLRPSLNGKQIPTKERQAGPVKREAGEGQTGAVASPLGKRSQR